MLSNIFKEEIFFQVHVFKIKKAEIGLQLF
jgi:hypothetical protein